MNTNSIRIKLCCEGCGEAYSEAKSIHPSDQNPEAWFCQKCATEQAQVDQFDSGAKRVAGGEFGETGHGVFSMMSRASRRVSSAMLGARRKYKEWYRRELHHDGEHDDGWHTCCNRHLAPLAGLPTGTHNRSQARSFLFRIREPGEAMMTG